MLPGSVLVGETHLLQVLLSSNSDEGGPFALQHLLGGGCAARQKGIRCVDQTSQQQLRILQPMSACKKLMDGFEGPRDTSRGHAALGAGRVLAYWQPRVEVEAEVLHCGTDDQRCNS